MVRALLSASVVVGMTCLWSQSAAAQGTYPDYAFGHEAGEIGTGVFAAASNFVYLIPQQKSDWGPFRPRRYDPLSAEWSDMFGALGGSLLQLGAGFVFEAAYLANAGAADPGILALHQTAVEAQSLMLTSGITAFIKKISGRCRPRAYRGPKEPCLQYDAFPSGHTSTIASFSGARMVRVAYTPADSGFPIRVGAWVLSDAAMTVTGILRALSGSHSWEDVVGGALIGYATGVTVALIHPNADLTREELAAGVGAIPLEPQQARMTPVFSWGGVF